MPSLLRDIKAAVDAMDNLNFPQREPYFYPPLTSKPMPHSEAKNDPVYLEWMQKLEQEPRDAK